MTDPTLDRKNCKCKYCGNSHKKQTEISQDLGLNRASSAPSGAGKPDSQEGKPKIRAKPRANFTGTPSGGPALPERVSDLRLGRLYRDAELVWCALAPPIQGAHPHERIHFWPSIISDSSIHTNVTNGNANAAWRVEQKRYYSIALFGWNGTLQDVPEDSLLPYQAWGPSQDLIDRLRIAGDPAIIQNKALYPNTLPVTLGSASTNDQLGFKDASTPFALSLQMAAHLLQFWTPTDEYVFDGLVPRAPQAGSAATGEITYAELKEIRYEGLWWGAERIWTDELIRLVPSRDQVKFNYALPPTPGSNTRAVFMQVNGFIAVLSERGREGRVGGVLYDLVDEVSQDPSITTNHPEPSTPQIAGNPIPSNSPLVNVQAPPLEALSPLPPLPPPAHPPNLPPYDLPPSPPGCKFRRITPQGYEVILDLSMIAGRYYTGLFDNPLIQNIVKGLNPDEREVLHIRALCGTVPGVLNSMECTQWKETRKGMIAYADKQAKNDLINNWRPIPKGDEQMDIMNEVL